MYKILKYALSIAKYAYIKCFILQHVLTVKKTTIFFFLFQQIQMYKKV